jgi:hypothetical protein
MAKKVIATLRTGEKVKFSKVILPIRSKKTGAYTFKEQIVVSTEVDKIISQL